MRRFSCTPCIVILLAHKIHCSPILKTLEYLNSSYTGRKIPWPLHPPKLKKPGKLKSDAAGRWPFAFLVWYGFISGASN